ncbi:MAG: hypothetical protein EOM62_15145, partial [Bacteroidia bacterium]|nr:hypothetical protein [Bacteroidia bacterium]
MTDLPFKILLSLQGKGYHFFLLFFVLLIHCLDGVSSPQGLYYFGRQDSDLFRLLRENGVEVNAIESLRPNEVKRLPDHGALLVVADGYPSSRTAFSEEIYKIIQKKSIRLYVEYPETLPGRGNAPEGVFQATLE